MGLRRHLRRWTARLRGANPRSLWDREYGGAGSDAHWASEVRLGFYDFAAEVIPREPLRILDVGSGLGYGGRRLAEICPLWKVEGFELSPLAAARAVIPTRCGDLLRDPIPAGFDFLTMIQTLEHFRDPAAVLARVVPAAGRGVVITVPYRGRTNRKHLASLDESSFAAWPDASFQLRRRVYEKDGSLKTDLRVWIPARRGADA
jgi:SAM-dependent methyltransferase